VILTLTPNPSVDVSIEVDELIPDIKLRAELDAFEPGGGGVNVSRVLHRLGAPTVAVVAVGGLSGGVVASQLEATGVAISPVAVREDTRWAWMVYERASGSEYRLITPGVPLSPDEWRACLAAVEGVGGAVEYVVLSGGMPPEVPEGFVHDLAVVSARLGARLLVDSHGPTLAAAVAEQVYLIKPSRRELAELSGLAPADLDYEAAARDLVARGVANVVVSLGREGAFLASADQAVHVHAPEVEVVSTVGAGDAMVAGLLAGLLEGRSMPDALRLGVAAGTAACLTAGSRPCRPDEVRRLEARLSS
jgi:6-phosphofructokinase 2